LGIARCSIEPRLVSLIMRGLAPRSPMEPVSMRSVLCVPVISAGMIGAALAIAARPAVAADCVAEPNRDAPPGQHWYYHGTDRKCWYLHATVPLGAAEAPAIELQSVHRRQAVPAGEPQRRIAVPAPVPQRRQDAPAPAADLQRQQAAAPPRQAPRSEADEAALYLEFLRWKEEHRDAQ
jgi:hypothetical protein